MVEACAFSFEEAPSPALEANMTYAARCPLCGAVRTSIPRAGGRRVFPWHRPPDAPLDKACWERGASGIWYWHWWTPKPKGESK